MIIKKQDIQDWENWIKQYLEDVADEPGQTPIERAKRIKRLEADPEEWFKYYFPKYCSAPSAPFHLAATKRLLEHRKWYEVRAWSRELAKSARAMFEITYLALTRQVRNVLVVSNSLDNAERLLLPFLLTLEHNKRLIADYGEQKIEGNWTSTEFIAKCGCAFRAIGAGQSPRGTRNEEIRPDFILIDDIDTDEECRKPERIKTKWKWIEEALLGTVSVSGNQRVLFNGNVIAKDCCVVRAQEKADYVDIINLRMVNIKKTNPQEDFKRGKSVWPAKNSEEDINYLISKRSMAAVLKEYFNCPITEGGVFKNVVYGICPPLAKFRRLVAYADPATSNSDKKGSSLKALVLLGELDGIFYVLRCYLDNCTNSTFVDWFFDLRNWIGQAKVQVLYYIENNTLQNPFYDQVFKPLFTAKGETQGYIPVRGDSRKKPGKFDRIEGNLEPLTRDGRLVLNEKEKNNPNMQRLEEQFLAVAPDLPVPVDGVDAVEGGIYMLNQRKTIATPYRCGGGASRRY